MFLFLFFPSKIFFEQVKRPVLNSLHAFVFCFFFTHSYSPSLRTLSPLAEWRLLDSVSVRPPEKKTPTRASCRINWNLKSFSSEVVVTFNERYASTDKLS